MKLPAESDRDDDFRRGETSMERFLTTDLAGSERNGSMGVIARTPFYATHCYVGLLSTKGGPRTDASG